ncbi:hypothetical protein Arub01_46820 [Actinomadura rubrobrunea]|uniref:Rod shape-determining protein n=1 Tax=Actinomadura rubrobrunea TaxID=115335 RepID=A0A9W6UXS3_9ACTN|nr:rod shape-determining protein [Actinomadura rubrobrunea]GLW66438.1 hypothetical protein Arub01_46820 [Actinomadura rubrobrunea]
MPFVPPPATGSPSDARPSPRVGPRAAIDLGSSRVRASVPAHEVMIDRPSAVHALRPRADEYADEYAGADVPPERHPIRHGMVVDLPGCARLARLTLADVCALPAPREVLLASPVGATDMDVRRAVAAVRAAAACPVRVLEAPLAAALGAGWAVTDPQPRLVADIGAGIVEMAVIIEGRLSHARSIQYVAERRPGPCEGGLPDHVRLQLVGELHQMVKDLPPRLRAQARPRGVLLTGGGALPPSLPGWLAARVGLSVTVAPDPARATIRGLARLCLAPAALRALVAPIVYGLSDSIDATEVADAASGT